ncbi:hypothetical protein B0I35DRAFT_348705 [Stachybotrys elegans]|uniref:DUF159 domain protein n=1 Tax=Stachybotrys elegans TaxID=80388 RepID=A0A8K0WU76_9HYPO|nr:hypothetical protein B0I35DRAFT_348705 [Stachybotrys elegans]
MCGRYALALRPSQIRRLLEQDNMPMAEWPEDDGGEEPRQSYNFAPGYHGVVYRADTPDWGAGPRRDEHGDATTTASDKSDTQTPTYKMQTMKWGLVPFWTKRRPDYGSLMKTINCRDDSLSSPGGMWASMKGRKRCIVIAQGFFEWLKAGPKDKVPHYIKRKDGRLMCMAGLWDCAQYEGPNQDTTDKVYTYTIITTDSNSQLRFLHDRMPVILEPGSKAMQTWLDPARYDWSPELQSLLKPWDGELEIYPVTKDVSKVGNSSPSFIIPIDSKENRSNIANFFSNAAKKQQAKKSEVKTEETSAKGIVPKTEPVETTLISPMKRKLEENHEELLSKTPKATKREQPRSGKISATKNVGKSPVKSKDTSGSHKITKFFANSA